MSSRRSVLSVFLCAMVCFSFAGTAFGQTGSLYTIIEDHAGLYIPDVTVEINSTPPISVQGDFGEVLIENIPVGTNYTVTVIPPEDYVPIEPITGIEIQENLITHFNKESTLITSDNGYKGFFIDIMPKIVSVTGTVTDSVTGAPIPYLTLKFIDDIGDPWYTDTGEDGVYYLSYWLTTWKQNSDFAEFSNLPDKYDNGSNRIYATYHEVCEDKIISNFELTPKEQLTGSLYVWPLYGGAYPHGGVSVEINTTPQLTAITSGNAEVTIENIPVGDNYTVTINPGWGYYPVVIDNVEILEGQTTILGHNGIVAFYPMPITLTGIVTDSETGLGIPGVKLTFFAYGIEIYPTETDQNGVYNVKYFPKPAWAGARNPERDRSDERYGAGGYINASFCELVGDTVTANFELTPVTTADPMHVVHVSPAGNDVTGTGTIFCPFRTIQKGIDTATVDDIVLLADGTYKGPGNVDLNLTGKGITVKSQNGPECCIIDCEKQYTNGFAINLNLASETRCIDGIKIINSTGDAINCNGLDTNDLSILNCIFCDNGGNGFFCDVEKSIISVEKTIFENNQGHGIFIHCGPYSGVVIKGNIIKGNDIGISLSGLNMSSLITENEIICNSSDGVGVGYYESTNILSHNYIANNQGNGISSGGPSSNSNVILKYNRIIGNKNYGYYGVENLLTMENCKISGNGGGIEYQGALEPRSLIISDSIINENLPNYGIRIYGSPLTRLTNCIVSDNSTGLSCIEVNLELINCTIVNNQEFGVNNSYDSWDTSLTILNSILWNHGQHEIIAYNSNLPHYGNIYYNIVVDHSNIKNGQEGIKTEGKVSDIIVNWLDGNIDKEPCFADGYHLSDMSPCIGAGTATGAPTTDIEGNTRGIPPDMGAYENELDEPVAMPEMSIAEAAAKCLINSYCYIWDGCEYIPVSPYDDFEIQPWQGFWVAAKNDIDLLFSDLHASNPAPPACLEKSFDPNSFHMVSVPLNPSNRDINVNVGDDLGDGLFEQWWRVSKWDYDEETHNNYTGPGTIPDLLPGRGFFLQHVYDDPKIIDITGDPIGAPFTGIAAGSDYYELKLPSNGDRYTFHMAGNPYWYSINWADCKVRVPMTDELPLAKPAVLTQDGIESWYIGLKLISDDGKARDTYNRAGVVMSSGIDPEQFCAHDLIPPGNYVRLFVTDPSNQNHDAYSYDYRSAGQDEYEWQIEVETTYNDIGTSLMLDNFPEVPENYDITLLDKDSGEVFELNGDRSFDLQLTSGVIRVFVLSAKKSGDIVAVEETAPAAFGITDIRPNPFNPTTTIRYSLETPGDVVLKVYNMSGQLVDTLTDGYQNAGRKNITWNAKGQASGVYVISLTADEKRAHRKVTLVK